MRPEESRYPSDWLRLAERDLSRGDQLLAGRDPELAGFCLQQAVEKFLKAFLLKQGWRLRRIHDLKALLDDAAIYDADVERFRAACETITTYYVVERYPLVVETQLTETEIRRSLEAIQDLVNRMRSTVQ